MKSKSKKQLPTWSQHWLLLHNIFTFHSKHLLFCWIHAAISPQKHPQVQDTWFRASTVIPPSMEPFGNGAMVLTAEAALQAMGCKPGLPCLFGDALGLRSCLHMPSASCSCTLHFMYESESEVAQSCPTFCDPLDCSPPGSSAHGILQARILEWVAISLSKGSSRPRDWMRSPALQADTLTSEPPGKPSY